MNDLMRFPLGILTGVGFIGAGAIIRRGNIIVGVTTAATLWYVTVIGLCLGGGQIWLGITAAAIGLIALWVLHWIELRLRRESRAKLYIALEDASLSENQIRQMLEAAGLRIAGAQITLSAGGKNREMVFDLLEYRLPNATEYPPIFETVAAEHGVIRLEWKRQ
jgi:putative Mg2+ transporter-C (MgtC) family protein